MNMKSWLITLYDDRALLAKAKTIVPEPNLVAYQTIVVIMVVRHKSTSVEDRRNTVERLRLFFLHVERRALKIGKRHVWNRFISRCYLPCTDKVGTLFLND
jgi:hypothetical protein